MRHTFSASPFCFYFLPIFSLIVLIKLFLHKKVYFLMCLCQHNFIDCERTGTLYIDLTTGPIKLFIGAIV